MSNGPVIYRAFRPAPPAAKELRPASNPPSPSEQLGTVAQSRDVLPVESELPESNPIDRGGSAGEVALAYALIDEAKHVGVGHQRRKHDSLCFGWFELEHAPAVAAAD